MLTHKQRTSIYIRATWHLSAKLVQRPLAVLQPREWTFGRINKKKSELTVITFQEEPSVNKSFPPTKFSIMAP